MELSSCSPLVMIAKNSGDESKDDDSGFASRENGDLEMKEHEESQELPLDPTNSQLVLYDENVALISCPFTTSTPVKDPESIPGTTLRYSELGEFLQFHDNPETMDVSEAPSEILSTSTIVNARLTRADQHRQIFMVVDAVSGSESCDDEIKAAPPSQIPVKEEKSSKLKMTEERESSSNNNSSESSDDETKAAPPSQIPVKEEKSSKSKVTEERESSSSSSSSENEAAAADVSKKALPATNMDQDEESSSDSDSEIEERKVMKPPTVKKCSVCQKLTRTIKGGFYTSVSPHHMRQFERCSQIRGDGLYSRVDLSIIALHKKCYRAYVNPKACEKFRKQSGRPVTRSKDPNPLQPLVEHTLKYLRRKGNVVRLSEVTRSFGGKPLNGHKRKEYLQRLKETPGMHINRDMENRQDPMLSYSQN